MSEPVTEPKYLWLVRTYYRVRAIAFAASVSYTHLTLPTIYSV